MHVNIWLGLVRVLIVEALVLIPTGIMGTLTKSVIADKKALFMTCLDESELSISTNTTSMDEKLMGYSSHPTFPQVT